MPENNKHIKQYTAQDIQRYLSRQMSASERHAIEKAALEDPFLAEAIEGYAQDSSGDFISDLTRLKQDIEKKAAPQQRRAGYARIWWSAAAAILIVTGTTLSWYWLTPASEEIAQKQNEIQKTETLHEKQNADTNVSETPVPPPPAPQRNDAEDKSISEGVAATRESARTQSATSSPQTQSALPSPAAAETNDETLPATGINPSRKDVIPDTINPQPEIREASAAKKSRAVQNNVPQAIEQPARMPQTEPAYVIKGEITDDRHIALPFVNIQIQGSNKTYADASGKFNLLSKDSVLDAELSSVGFQKQKVMLSSGKRVNHLTLHPLDGKQSAPKISGYAGKKEEGNTRELSLRENSAAAPVDGWEKYSIYLANNTRLPGGAPGGNRGQVALQFSVDTNGRLSDFKIKHSTCSTCNSEAIRVVKEGPGWRLTGDILSAQVNLTIPF